MSISLTTVLYNEKLFAISNVLILNELSIFFLKEGPDWMLRIFREPKLVLKAKKKKNLASNTYKREKPGR